MNNSNYTIIDDLRIPLRDAVQLSARVWMPADLQELPLPAVLEVLPYRKRDGTAARDGTTHGYFAENGYVCLRVDLRGTGDSQGLFDDEYSERELADIEDIINWVAKQFWCDGAVGIMGISWGGINGLQMTTRRPCPLKAVITASAVVDRFSDDIHYKGGIELSKNIGWATKAMSVISLPPDPAVVGDEWADIWLERLKNTSFLPGIWARHRTRDAYWKRGSVCEDFDKIEIPILSFAGLNDGYRNLPIKLLEGTKQSSKAILGPWDHNYPHISSYGPWLNFPAEALRWWDRWLKGKENGVEHAPALRAFIIDGSRESSDASIVSGNWVAAQTWPTETIKYIDYHLDNAGLTTQAGVVDKWIHTEPLCGIASGEFFSTQLCSLDRPGEQAPDDNLSLLFETDQFRKSKVFLGAPRAILKLASNKPWGQVVARLCDVGPDGSSRLISIAMLNMVFRNSFETPVALRPGEVYTIELNFDHIGYQLSEGHKLRLALSGSYWPFCWPEIEEFSLHLQEGQLFLPEFVDGKVTEVDELPAKVDQTKFARPLKDRLKRKFRFEDNGRWVLETIYEDGGIEIEEHNLRRFSSAYERWSIDPDDISSPCVDIVWTNSVSRDDFRAETRLTTSMRAEAEFFHIEGTLEASNGDEQIFFCEFCEKVL
ncbi:MAG: CocE/NonD family hydrolase, partial [Roseibium sp.]|uniref:CocE/NonD family hydrolase n=1 Tax=Roseibium sp. TaxID=1936156 RepID=UPI0026181CA8